MKSASVTTGTLSPSVITGELSPEIYVAIKNLCRRANNVCENYFGGNAGRYDAFVTYHIVQGDAVSVI